MLNSRFSYLTFVKDNMDNNDNPISPSNLIRGAMNNGAVGSVESVYKGIRMACESLANSADFKRIRTADVAGYQYMKKK